ncbi:SigE family RNA polymerase sigma factor [Streptomyces sp. NPDC054861]
MQTSRADEFLEFASARSGHLFRSACLMTSGDTHLAEDLVQETLGRLYARWGRMGRVGNPAGYAQTVLVRTFLGHQRRRSATERPFGELPDRAREGADDPALRIALLDALASLTAKDRAVVVLRYWEDRSIEETAAALQMSSAAVRTRSVRALGKLRASLGGSIAAFASR